MTTLIDVAEELHETFHGELQRSGGEMEKKVLVTGMSFVYVPEESGDHMDGCMC